MVFDADIRIRGRDAVNVVIPFGNQTWPAAKSPFLDKGLWENHQSKFRSNCYKPSPTVTSDWCFGTFGLFFHILGMASSQLTKSYF